MFFRMFFFGRCLGRVRIANRSDVRNMYLFKLVCGLSGTVDIYIYHIAGLCVCVCVCDTLQHTATHCNTLQHTATHCNKLVGICSFGDYREISGSVLAGIFHNP